MENQIPNETLNLEEGTGLYQYQPFPDSNSIRILTLHPGNPEDLLTGDLECLALAAFPTYSAISYVWGDPSLCDSIALNNGAKLKLTRSLGDALRRVRHATDALQLWADQICINQGDLVERSMQVKLMNEIYKNARWVWVWLGRDEQGIARDVFELVMALHVIFDDEDDLERFTREQREELDEFSNEVWGPLAQFFKLPWFNRMWILQEIGTDAPAELMWGDAKLNWEVLWEVCRVLERKHHPLRKRFDLIPTKVNYLHRRFEEIKGPSRRNFIYELHRARPLNASDPRDHVYALLGHHSARKGPAGLPIMEADYTKPLAEIYHEVAVRTLTGANSLITLNAVHHVKPLEAANDGLPSWVPRWDISVSRHMLGYPGSIFQASRTSLPILKLTDSQSCLQVEGLEIDIVERCSERLVSYDFALDASNHSTVIQTLWTTICGHSDNAAFTLDEPYAPRPETSSVHAYCQTLSAACLLKAVMHRNAHASPATISHDLADGAAYLAKMVRTRPGPGGTVASVSAELRELAHTGDAYSWSRCVRNVSRFRMFARTTYGYYCLLPDFARKGDVVAVLFGGMTPFCLRPREGDGGGGGGGYLLLGECYVHGLMDGEAVDMLERGELEWRTFEIR